jgi:Fe-S oxidoreductase
MCPSYMVTREERHSTRGRAHLLWEMLRGGGPIEGGMRDESVKESLDLCLACKGCKGDCPVNVDVATYKAEFLAGYYEGRLRPRQAYAFGWIHRWARLASFVPALANAATQLPLVRSVAKAAAGIHPERSIPPFATTFRAWFANRETALRSDQRVVLWVDTFCDHFHPETARAAVTVLEHFGFEVAIPDRAVCCGRPLYDFGMLDEAKRYLEETLAVLRPHLDAGTPIVVLEPSCASVFRDELREMMPLRADATKLRKQTVTLSELIDQRVDPAKVPELRAKALVQKHCHHHAIMRFDAEERVMRAMKLDFEVLDSGCCGMAGSFGFEEDKLEISRACGERVVLPRVRAAEPSTLVIADGFSCKTQIAQGTSRRALHLAEVLEMAITREASSAPFVESKRADAADRAVRGSVMRGLALLALGAIALGWGVLRRHPLRP